MNGFWMRLVGLLMLVFMVSALGGWFGVRYAGNEVSGGGLEAELAKLSGRLTALEKSAIDNAEPLPEDQAAVKDIEPAVASGAETSPSPDAMEPEAVDREEDRWPQLKRKEFEARADQELIQFTDLEGRVVEAQLVDVTLEKVRIIRSTDQRQFQVPVERLIESDREFVEFLVETGRYAPQSDPDSGEIDWAAIFGDGSV